jgi:hypothetical protein
MQTGPEAALSSVGKVDLHTVIVGLACRSPLAIAIPQWFGRRGTLHQFFNKGTGRVERHMGIAMDQRAIV